MSRSALKLIKGINYGVMVHEI